MVLGITLRHMLLVLFFLTLFYIIYFSLRWRTLKRGYKESGLSQFIDYFEIHYLGLWKFSWRREFNKIYNSKIYWVLYGILLGILCALNLFTIIVSLVIGLSDMSGILDQVIL